jgi:hypothetical protein
MSPAGSGMSGCSTATNKVVDTLTRPNPTDVSTFVIQDGFAPLQH